MNVNKRQVVICAVSLVALSYISMKLSSPALPILQEKLHTKAVYLKLSGAFFFLSYSISQIIWGAISHYIGRRKEIFIALIIAALGTVLTMLSTNIAMFFAGRLIEGFGIGVGSCMARVIFSDCLSKLEIARNSFYFGLVFNLMPFMAPTIGQYLIIFLDWRAIFAFFLLLIIICYIGIYFFMPETRLYQKKDFFSLSHIFKKYLKLLSDQIFLVYEFIFVLFFSVLVGYYIAIPYWYLAHFHINEKFYTFLALVTAIPNAIAYFYSARIMKKVGETNTIRIACIFGMSVAVTSLLSAFFLKPSPVPILISMFMIAIASGLAQPAINAILLTYYKEDVGIVSGLIPMGGFISTGITFFVFSNLSLKTLWPYTFVMLTVALLSLIMNLCLSRKSLTFG